MRRDLHRWGASALGDPGVVLRASGAREDVILGRGFRMVLVRR